MQRPDYLITIDIKDSLSKAANKMRDEGVHHLIVVNQGKLVGLLSDRDTLKVWTKSGGRGLNELKVKDAYREDLPSISPDSTVEEAVGIMERENTDALLVDTSNGVGIVTTLDLLESLSSRSNPSGMDFTKLTFSDPLLQKIMKTLADIGI